jgi:hypothetical protein
MGTGTGKDTGQGGRKALADWGGCAQRLYQDSRLREELAVLQYGLPADRIDGPPVFLGCVSNSPSAPGTNSPGKGCTAATEANQVRSQ